MHEVDVLGERLADATGERVGAPVRDEPAPDLGLDLLFQLLDPGVVLVLEQAFLEGGELTRPSPPEHVAARRIVGALLRPGHRGARHRTGLGHEPGEHAVEVEAAKRPVEVVGAADRTPGLHRRVAGHREPCDRGEHRRVADTKGLVQHRCDLLGRHLIPAGGPERVSAESFGVPR